MGGHYPSPAKPGPSLTAVRGRGVILPAVKLIRFGTVRGDKMVSNQGRPYRRKEWLRQKFYEEGLTLGEMAEEAGVAYKTVRDWFITYGFDTGHDSDPDHSEYKDEEWMRDLYVNYGLSSREIANMMDVSQRTVLRWLDHHGIETRDGGGSLDPEAVSLFTDTNKSGSQAYEFLCISEGDEAHKIRVHRLLAVAEYGMEAVKDNYVHHKSRIGWHNTPENIEVMTPEEHGRHHYEEHGIGGDPFTKEDFDHRDEETLRELYVDRGLSMSETAEKLGCSISTVYKWLHKHDIEADDQP